MIKFWSVTLIVPAISFGLVTSHASPFASSAAALKATTSEAGVVEQVHACNRVCERGRVEEWGGAIRWHRHVGKTCHPVSCRPS
jgi:hypothetical protein